jgi:hypothetical protein
MLLKAKIISESMMIVMKELEIVSFFLFQINYYHYIPF